MIKVNKALSHGLVFLFGAAAGAFTSWRLLKDVYKAKSDAEIESVRKAYNAARPQIVDYDPIDQTRAEKWVRSDPDHDIPYKAIIEKLNYVPATPDIPKKETPYTISPDEYGEFYEYEKVDLIYFADGVVADNEYDILTRDEIETSIGFDSLTHFGEYEEDTVYVRNDAKRCDYEITKDLRNYSELRP